MRGARYVTINFGPGDHRSRSHEAENRFRTMPPGIDVLAEASFLTSFRRAAFLVSNSLFTFMDFTDFSLNMSSGEFLIFSRKISCIFNQVTSQNCC